MNANKKIAFVMPWHISERGGGAEVQANYLAVELSNRGFKVYYICQTHHERKVNCFESINGLSIFWLKPSGRFQWLDQNKYYKPLNGIKPDIVIQRLSSNVNYIIGNYCKKNNAIYNWICTDNLSPYKDFHVKKFKQKIASKNISLLKFVVYVLNAKIMDCYRNAGMKYIDYGFSQNEFQRKIIKSSFGINTRQIITGHHIPLNQYSTKQKFLRQTVLWCANFGAHKRPEQFIALARQMLDTPFKFVMVGGHRNKAYMDSVLKDKPSNLYCTGQLPFEKALSYFDKATVLINTSVSEGFSNTYIQSWVRGLPVVVLGADPDAVIQKKQLGFNVASLDEAIEKVTLLLTDYQVYKVLSNNASDYGRKRHSVKTMTDNFLKVIST
ncbi:glycosyltransferase family 4 protein [Flavivirga sp. 57AJ16]|uniref:glycosyltransferase family 4 protein n=1 Tax=Flavivirga sp. 57AJ16 TaxID=3025307 RepID=UPI00236714A3|nr:glycosyltransferase family 4 protein [Flavivirga sp. 57AJ16]MDD7886238.1 glycosyltransferase family 4 protein [Flavivirga sp. 57AJ16]